MALWRFGSIVAIALFTAGAAVVAAPAKPSAPGKKQAAKKKQPAKPPAGKPKPAAGSGAPGDKTPNDAASADAGSGSGSGSGSAAPPAPPPEPPPDMQGTSETPEDPKIIGLEASPEPIPQAAKPTGYPTEEALRPLTLPTNLFEISIAPHLQVSPLAGSDALRARYGITSNIQLGLTYLYAGLYDQQQLDPGVSSKYELHGGKAFGIDATVRIREWIAVKAGVPMYVNPFAVSLALGVPLKFSFAGKYAVGGLDDLLDIRLYRFAPSFYQELINASGALGVSNHTQQSRGHLRFSAYGIYQHSPLLAFIGRVGIDNDLGLTSDGPAGTTSGGGTVTFIRAGLQYAVRRYFDAGISFGWDSLAKLGSFGPQLLFALRI